MSEQICVKLNNGVEMPMAGIGTFLLSPDEAESSVLSALQGGYRLIDTANAYVNEEEVGSAIRKSGVPREEIFLTSKVWVEHYGYEEARKSVEESLRKLQTDYLDLMLLHQPFNDYYGAYRALEDMYEEGKLKAIGVSNFYPDRLVDLASFTKIPPMVNQIETHVLNQRQEDHTWMEKYKVAHEAWAPFGEGRGGLFENETLKDIGRKYGKTTAQVMLRWNIQRGVIVLPKSTHKERMVQNMDVFDFSLTQEDMGAIAALDTKTSAFFSHYDPNMVEWFVKMVEERKQQHDSSREKKNW